MRKLLFTVIAVAAVAGLSFAAELKSGPQAGDKIPGPFHPMNINGESAGQKACLVCKHGDSPVAMVFARNADCPATAKLIKKLDAATVANAKAELGTFVVFLTDDDKTGDKLKAMAEKESIKHTTIAVDNPAGPAKYNVEKDADITVVLYTERAVKANYSFKKGEMKDSDIEAVIKDLSKILPAAK